MAFKQKYDETQRDDYNERFYLRRDVFKDLCDWYDSGRRSLIITGPENCGKATEAIRLACTKGCETIYVNSNDEYDKFVDLCEAYENGDEIEQLEAMGLMPEGEFDDCLIIFDNFFDNAAEYSYSGMLESMADRTSGCRAIFIGTGIDLKEAWSNGVHDTIRMRTLTFSEVANNFMSLVTRVEFDTKKVMKKLFEDYNIVGGYPTVVLKYFEGVRAARSAEEIFDTLENNRDKAFGVLDNIYDEIVEHIMDMYSEMSVTGSGLKHHAIAVCLSAERAGRFSSFVDAANFVGQADTCSDDTESADCGYAFWAEELVDTGINLDTGSKVAWFSDAGIQSLIQHYLLSEEYQKLVDDDVLRGVFMLREIHNQLMIQCGVTNSFNLKIAMNTPTYPWEYVGDGEFKPGSRRILLFGSGYAPLKEIEAIWDEKTKTWSYDENVMSEIINGLR